MSEKFSEESGQAETQPRSRAALLRDLGFAWRRRGQAARTWRETVTHFKPEPWLVALAHEQTRTKVKLRDLPDSSK